MTEVVARISGGSSVVSLLNGIVLSGPMRRGLMEELGDTIVTQTELRFVDGVGPDGVAWTPSYRALAQGGQTLLDTGRLRSSITKLAGEDSVEVGTNLDYALPNQMGASISAKAGKFLTFKVGTRWSRKAHVTIPERPFLGFNAADEAEIGETVVAYLSALLDRAGA